MNLKNRIIAHRGYHDKKQGIPENSIPAFERAILYGYDIELDVHLLKDGTVVVFHDDNLKRMTGIDKKLANCTYEEIKKYRLQGTQYPIPLLQEVLELVDGKVLLDIELKYDRRFWKLEEKLFRMLDSYKGDFIVKSFHPSTVFYIRLKRPHYIRGQLVTDYLYDNNIAGKIFLKNMVFNFLTKPNFIAVSTFLADNKRVMKLRKKGIPVLVWNVKSQEEYEKVKDFADSMVGEQMEKWAPKG